MEVEILDLETLCGADLLEHISRHGEDGMRLELGLLGFGSQRLLDLEERLGPCLSDVTIIVGLNKRNDQRFHATIRLREDKN